MNDYQRKIKDTTEKLMALVAELSMKQALAIELQKEVKDKEDFIFSCNSRIEKGLPLNKDIEKEWLKVLRNEEMYTLAIAEKSKVSSGLYIVFIRYANKTCYFNMLFYMLKYVKNIPLHNIFLIAINFVISKFNIKRSTYNCPKYHIFQGKSHSSLTSRNNRYLGHHDLKYTKS